MSQRSFSPLRRSENHLARSSLPRLVLSVQFGSMVYVGIPIWSEGRLWRLCIWHKSKFQCPLRHCTRGERSFSKISISQRPKWYLEVLNPSCYLLRHDRKDGPYRPGVARLLPIRSLWTQRRVRFVGKGLREELQWTALSFVHGWNSTSLMRLTALFIQP